MSRSEGLLGLILALIGIVVDNNGSSDYIAYVLYSIAFGLVNFWIYGFVKSLTPRKAIPISFRPINPITRSYGEKNQNESTFEAIIKSSNAVRGTVLKLEYHHKYSRGSAKYFTTKTVFTDIHLSSVGEQLSEVISARKFFRPNMTEKFRLSGIYLTPADVLIKTVRDKNIVDMVFSHPDFKPVKKRVWINGKGQLFTSNPRERWEDAEP